MPNLTKKGYSLMHLKTKASKPRSARLLAWSEKLSNTFDFNMLENSTCCAHPSFHADQESVITIINPDFRIVRISPTLAHILGREAERMADTPLEDHLTADSIEIFCGLLDKAAERKTPTGTVDDLPLEADLTWLGEQAAAVRTPTAVSILHNDKGDWLGFICKHGEAIKAVDTSPEARLKMISRITSAVMQENDSRRLLSRCSEILATFLQATAFGSYLLTPDRQLAKIGRAHV